MSEYDLATIKGVGEDVLFVRVSVVSSDNPFRINNHIVPQYTAGKHLLRL